MIVEILFILFLLALCCLVGLPIAYCLLSHKKMWWLMAPLLGVALISIINLSLWVHGSTIEFNFWLILFSGVVSNLFLVKRYLKLFGIDKQFRSSIFVYLLGLSFILAPLMWHGPKFSFFQGNIWDTFGYWEASQIYAIEKFETIKNFTEEDIRKIPARKSAKKDLYARPGIHAFYSLVTRAFPTKAWRLHPIFLAFLLSQTILVFIFWYRNLPGIGYIRPFTLTLIALAYPLGFWGQYIFDINTWGNISTVALMVFACWLLFQLIEDDKWNISISLGLVLGAILMLYPEISVFYAPSFVVVAALATFKARRKLDLLRKGLVAIGVAMAIGSLHYNGTIAFVINQIKFGTTEQHGMWTYFQKFFFGQGDLALLLKERAESVLATIEASQKTYAVGKVDWTEFIKNFLFSEGGMIGALEFLNNILLGFLGLYWLSLPVGLDPIIHDVFIILFSVVILFSIIQASLIFRKPQHKNYSLGYLLLVLSMTLGYFVYKNQFWSVGKGITFLMPMVFLQLGISLARGTDFKIQKYFLVCFFSLHLIWAGYRPFSVSDNGAHFPYPPYPSLQKHVSSLKSALNDEFFLFEKNIGTCEELQIANINPWLSRIFEVIALNNNLKFITESNVLVDYVRDEDLIYMNDNKICKLLSSKYNN